MSDKNDRIKGVLVGQAAGDALGVHYELGIPSNGQAEMLGGGYGFEPGEWSDDTQQALCIALAASDPAGVAVNLVSWYQGNPPDVGPTAGRVLSQVRDHPNTLKTHPERVQAHLELAAKRAADGRAEGQVSNGSLMRCGPTCLPFLGDRDKIAQVARQVSDLTHFDPYAGDAVVLWSLAIEAAIELGEAFEVGFIVSGVAHLPAERQEFWTTLINQVIGSESYRPPRSNLNVIKAFGAALWAVSHSFSYEQGVQEAIAIGGDTDTIAAIAGALLGAIFGASTVPQEWVKVLHGKAFSKNVMTAVDLETIAMTAAYGSSGQHGENGTDDPEESAS